VTQRSPLKISLKHQRSKPSTNQNKVAQCSEIFSERSSFYKQIVYDFLVFLFQKMFPVSTYWRQISFRANDSQFTYCGLSRKPKLQIFTLRFQTRGSGAFRQNRIHVYSIKNNRFSYNLCFQSVTVMSWPQIRGFRTGAARIEFFQSHRRGYHIVKHWWLDKSFSHTVLQLLRAWLLVFVYLPRE
jgi:hypothetical protein